MIVKMMILKPLTNLLMQGDTNETKETNPMGWIYIGKLQRKTELLCKKMVFGGELV